MFAPPSASSSGRSDSGGSLRCDNLAAKYSALAGDGAQGPKAREAAMLFSAAEQSLNDEDIATALAKAKEALALFREVGDKGAEADSLRLVVSSMAEREEPPSPAQQEALDLASQELEAFRTSGAKRGEAAMLLSVAEITSNNFGNAKREEAIKAAMQARELFAELKDAKMEGIALLGLVNARITKGTKHDSRQELERAIQAASDALPLFRSIQDTNGEAKALHSLAVTYSYLDAPEETAKYGKQALALWRELGVKKFEGMELRCLGEWQLANEKPDEALKLAEAALKVFEELGNGKGWEAAALSTVVRTHLKLEDIEKAHQLVKDAARSFQSRADEAGEVTALSLMVEIQLAKDDKPEALAAAERCLDAIKGLSKRTAADRKFEANMIHTIAQIHLAEEAYTRALDWCKDAVALCKDIGDKQQHALVLHTLSNVNIGLKEFREAVKTAAESRDIFRKRGHRRGHAYSCLACCHAYTARGEHNRAISMTKEAQKIFSEEKHLKGEADALAMLAEVYLMKGNSQKCLIAAKEARNLYRETSQSIKELEELFIIAKAEFWNAHAGGTPQSKGEKPSTAWETALSAAQEALTVSRKMNIEQSIVAALFSVGQIYVILRQPDQAAKVIDEALPMSQKMEDARAEANLEVLTSQMHIMNGKENQATEPARRAVEIFKEKLNDADGEDIALELIRYVEGGGAAPKGGAAEGDDAADSQAGGAITEYQGPTLEDLIATISDVALSLMGVESLAGDTPLMDAGLDSLASVEFQNNLQKEFQGVQLPSTLVFDFPSVKTMSEFINGGLREAAGFKPLEG